MASPRDRKLLIPLLLLPVVAIVLMIARAELVLQTGKKWMVRIGGYDPRDLLSGHYLSYRINWNMQTTACKGSSCCYCLWQSGPDAPPVEPAVSVISCSERAPCESWFPAEQLSGMERFFIPEGQGAKLERAIRDRQAHLLISVSPRGRVVIEDLLLDRRPWREALR